MHFITLRFQRLKARVILFVYPAAPAMAGSRTVDVFHDFLKTFGFLIQTPMRQSVVSVWHIRCHFTARVSAGIFLGGATVQELHRLLHFACALILH